MYFNGFTLLIMLVSLFIGFLVGVRYENTYQQEKMNNWINGESIEDQMSNDGWRKP